MLERYGSQVRSAGLTGSIVGLDMGALLLAAEALGYERDALMALLPWAESGMMAGVRKARASEGGE